MLNENSNDPIIETITNQFEVILLFYILYSIQGG